MMDLLGLLYEAKKCGFLEPVPWDVDEYDELSQLLIMEHVRQHITRHDLSLRVLHPAIGDGGDVETVVEILDPTEPTVLLSESGFSAVEAYLRVLLAAYDNFDWTKEDAA